jgi:DNA-binding HxlR family transcriptional regulator
VRTYGQYCSLARALDLVGDRWTLLIIRELAIRPCRYRDLRDGLPGMATNLLADRLRDLVNEGLVAKVEAPPPVGSTVYELTEFGRGLEPIMQGLARWATPLMFEPPSPEDAFRSRWLVQAVPSVLGTTTDPELALRVRFLVGDDEPADVVAREGNVTVELNAIDQPDLTIEADGYTTMGLLVGALGLEAATAVTGTAAARRRFAKLQAAAPVHSGHAQL